MADKKMQKEHPASFNPGPLPMERAIMAERLFQDLKMCHQFFIDEHKLYELSRELVEVHGWKK